MSTIKDLKGNRSRKMFLGGTLPWGVCGSNPHSKSVAPSEQEQVESLVTDPEQIKSILLDITEKDECAYFKRCEHGTVYRCQVKIIDDSDPLKKARMTAARQAELAKRSKPLLFIYSIVPLLLPHKMEPGQVLIVIFSAHDWHYRADLVVLSALETGWKISYPERCVKVGRMRKSFRVVATDTDTCMRIVQEAGRSMADPDVCDVSMGGCSFTVPPNEPMLIIGSPININLEWGNFTVEERCNVSLQGVIKAVSANGRMYHVAFTDVGESPETESLLEQLMAFVQSQRLNRRRRKYRGICK